MPPHDLKEIGPSGTGLSRDASVNRANLAPDDHVSAISSDVRGDLYSVLDERRHYARSIEYVDCDSETGTLREVIIGFPDNMLGFERSANRTQEAHVARGDHPTPEATVREFRAFKKLLEGHGVRVHIPIRHETREQIYTRDIGFVIGDTYFVANMAESQRHGEIGGIWHLISQLPNLVRVPKGVHIEGGNVIVDGDIVYLGLGQRTNGAAVEFLRRQLRNVSGGRFTLEPVHLKTANSMGSLSAANDDGNMDFINDDDEDALHLDCAFMPVGERHALIYPQVMRNIPESMKQRTWIQLTGPEQALLGTNILSLSPKKVVSRDAPIMARLNEEMREAGIEVLTIPFDQAVKCGGSFRCCTQPIVRGGVYLMTPQASEDQRVVSERLLGLKTVRLQIAALQEELARQEASVMDGIDNLVDHASRYIEELFNEYRGRKLPDFFNGIGTDRIDMSASGIDPDVLANALFLRRLRERCAAYCREHFQVSGYYHILQAAGLDPENLIPQDHPYLGNDLPSVASMEWLTADQIGLEVWEGKLFVKYRHQFQLPDGRKVFLKIHDVRRKDEVTEEKIAV
jgi:N-dimethylarginine dimethylaminohydrolase